MADVLVIAAHPDDEALGCGGAMARHAAAGDTVHPMFLTDGVGARDAHSDASRDDAGRRVAARAAAARLGAEEPVFFQFPDNRLDTVALLDVVQAVESVARKIGPRIVYTHHADDLNVDHRICHQAALTAFRPAPGEGVKAIYAFEVASSTAWAFASFGLAFRPVRYVDITAHLEAKMEALAAYDIEMRAFPHDRSMEALRARATMRGGEVGVAAAEAFTVVREVI